MADTFDATVDTEEGHSYIQFSGSLDLTGNLTDSHYSQAFKIAECNNEDAGFFAKASGGGGTNGDVDVRLEVSNDRENWVDAGQLVDLDADATARTGNVLAGGTGLEEFHAYKWARIEADGLASNDETTVDWSLNTTKNDQAVDTIGNTEVENKI